MKHESLFVWVLREKDSYIGSDRHLMLLSALLCCSGKYYIHWSPVKGNGFYKDGSDFPNMLQDFFLKEPFNFSREKTIDCMNRIPSLTIEDYIKSLLIKNLQQNIIHEQEMKYSLLNKFLSSSTIHSSNIPKTEKFCKDICIITEAKDLYNVMLQIRYCVERFKIDLKHFTVICVTDREKEEYENLPLSPQEFETEIIIDDRFPDKRRRKIEYSQRISATKEKRVYQEPLDLWKMDIKDIIDAAVSFLNEKDEKALMEQIASYWNETIEKIFRMGAIIY